MPPGRLCEIRCQQSLTDAPDGSRAQHRRDARHHHFDSQTRTIRNFLEGFADKPFDLVFRNRENLRVNWIVMLNRQHPN